MYNLKKVSIILSNLKNKKLFNNTIFIYKRISALFLKAIIYTVVEFGMTVVV